MTKVLFRPVKESDLEGVYQLACQAGFGLTTLPAEKKVLQERILHSQKSFSKTPYFPENEYYFFILECVQTKKIVGSAAIESAVGYDLPFFSYVVSKKTHICHDLDFRVELSLLNCVNDLQGCSELGTLFLLPEYRKHYQGLFLSRARLMFMKVFLNRFSAFVIAEMRGVSDEKGCSPFWNAVGKNFFNMSFVQADKLSMMSNKQFINDLMPVHPIYINMLSQDAQAVIGQAHQSSVPAMRILEKEGFYFNNYVDIFDAGPTIKAKVSNLKTVKNSQIHKVINITNQVSAKSYFISNVKNDFKAMIAPVMMREDGIILSKNDAEIINVSIGDEICVTPIKD